jgi:hypothetical protein
MLAVGMTPQEVRRRTGYSIRRLSLYLRTPAFLDLIEHEKADALEGFNAQTDAYAELKTENGLLAEQMINDKIHDTISRNEFLPTRELIAISADYADRFGYSKRAEVQHNHSFADLLDKAIERSGKAKLINGTAQEVVPVKAGFNRRV